MIRHHRCWSVSVHISITADQLPIKLRYTATFTAELSHMVSIIFNQLVIYELLQSLLINKLCYTLL